MPGIGLYEPTLLDSKGVFLHNRMVDTPSRVLEGPEAAIEAMAKAIELAIGGAGVHWPIPEHASILLWPFNQMRDPIG